MPPCGALRLSTRPPKRSILKVLSSAKSKWKSHLLFRFLRTSRRVVNSYTVAIIVRESMSSSPASSDKDAHGLNADLIFTFAGRTSRKLYSCSLFENGEAKRLMLSTGRFELRRFPQLPIRPTPDLIQMAAPIPPAQRHCCVLFEAGSGAAQVIWIRKKRFGTLTEVEFLRDWLGQHVRIRKVRIVSSGYHLPRIRLCCWFLIPAQISVQFSAVPNGRFRFVRWLSEMCKSCLYFGVLIVMALFPRRSG